VLLPLWSSAETVSAATLLDRAEAVPATTYHPLISRQTQPEGMQY
jgi:hypothetical protein